MTTCAQAIKEIFTSKEQIIAMNKAEWKGRSPTNDAKMMLAPRKVISFKCSGKLREWLNGAE